MSFDISTTNVNKELINIESASDGWAPNKKQTITRTNDDHD